ncbi:MAG TPA: TetR/AcrR family transcriptional regulator [Polyangiaceae bacterium]|nr:TetR/AcrR family transcriptional regulator [Polyangiaceae bacterium]
MRNGTSTDKAFARKPQQQRARIRCERVLDEARKLLIERGVAGFSIPDLATRLGYSRAAIYNFFPAPSAIFNELTQRYLLELEAQLFRNAPEPLKLSWQDGAHAFATLAAKFYNRNPAACILILGGSTSNESTVAQALLLQRLGSLVEQRFVQRGIVLPSSPPNVALLSVEIGTACLRASFFLHGKVTPEYQREAGKAMIAYLSQYVTARSAAKRASKRR